MVSKSHQGGHLTPFKSLCGPYSNKIWAYKVVLQGPNINFQHPEQWGPIGLAHTYFQPKKEEEEEEEKNL